MMMVVKTSHLVHETIPLIVTTFKLISELHVSVHLFVSVPDTSIIDTEFLWNFVWMAACHWRFLLHLDMV